MISNKNAGRAAVKYNRKQTVAMVCVLCVIACGIGVWAYKARQYSGGWEYIFQKVIPVSGAFPKDYHSLTVDDTSVYINEASGYTYSLNRYTGALNWLHEEQGETIYPISLGNPRLIFVTNFDGRLYAIDRKTGQEAWRFTTPGLYMADTEPQESDGFVYFGSRNGKLYALDELTGAVRWEYQTTPIDMSYYAPNENIHHFGRFTLDEKNIYLYSATDKTLFALDKKTGKLLWRFGLQGYKFQKPSVFTKSIAILDTDKTYYVLDKTSGKTLYSADMSEKSLFKGGDRSYIVSPDGGISSVNMADGSVLWSTFAHLDGPYIVKEVNDKFLTITGKSKGTQYVTLLNRESGKQQWALPVSGYGIKNIRSVFADSKQMYVLGFASQCSILLSGEKNWCTKDAQPADKAFITDSYVYFVSDEGAKTKITLIEKQSGRRRWTFESENVNTDIMEIRRDDIYFVSKNIKSVFMLNSGSPLGKINSSNIRGHRNNPGQTRHFYTPVLMFIKRIGKQILKNPSTVIAPKDPVNTNDVYELSINLDESQFINKYDDVDIRGTFSDVRGNSFKIRAFYYDKNTWKMRFTPPSADVWKWKVTGPGVRASGSFTAGKQKNPGFLSISKKDPRIFILPEGNAFFPIGIQTCTTDMKQIGNPLSTWFVGTDTRPPSNPASSSVSSMDKYLATYAASGFNLFRWGSQNCSFSLWKTLAPSGNRYAVNGGVWADTLFTTLRNRGYHVWITLFSFKKLPLDDTLTIKQKQDILRRYMDYVVARYAGMIDVWELANEIHLDDATVGFMADYIRSVDPYHHPITTNWEHADHPSIDIASVHWYSQECDGFCDTDVTRQLEQYQNIKKPFVFSEQGNLFSNWDDQSATRMRIRLWVGYFAKMFYVYWNASRQLMMDAKGNPANLYIGPVERQYVSIFHTFISHITAVPTTNILTSHDAKVYAVSSGNTILGYVYRRIGDTVAQSSEIPIDIPSNGKIRWISPTSGETVSERPVEKGPQFLESPEYTTDISFIISPE